LTGDISTLKLHSRIENEITIPFAKFRLHGELAIPPNAGAVVLFAHGSGSSRHSPRNQLVARALREQGLGTLLFDLLTEAEEEEDRYKGHLRFDIRLLTERLLGVTRWLRRQAPDLGVGYFGSSTGAAAALLAAAEADIAPCAIVSRGGRPDLAGAALRKVQPPTLLIVGANDTTVVELNRRAYAEMRCPKDLRLITGATHLFEEPGTLEQVANLAAEWFVMHFRTQR
jgi:dienelactone hydrolase